MRNQALITSVQHQKWFESIHQDGQQQHYIIYYKTHKLGSINIRSLDDKPLNSCEQAEIGLYLVHPDYRGNILAFAPSLLITDFAFETLNIELLASEVRSGNEAAIKYNQQLGYQMTPKDNEFMAIELRAKDYHDKTQILKRMLNRK